MKNKLQVTLLLSLLALLVTGCAKLLVTTTIRSNGSGTNEFIFALDKNQVPAGNIFWTSLNINQRGLEKEGATVESWKDGSYEGFKATFDFQSLEEMKRQLTESHLGDSTGYGDSSLRVIFTSVDAWFDENNIAHFTAKGNRSGAIETGSENTFTLVMPGRIISYNEESAAKQTKSNTVVYDLTNFNGREFEINVTSKINRIEWVLAIFALVCIGIVVIIGISILIVLTRRKKSHVLSTPVQSEHEQ